MLKSTVLTRSFVLQYVVYLNVLQCVLLYFWWKKKKSSLPILLIFISIQNVIYKLEKVLVDLIIDLHKIWNTFI